MPEQKIKYNLVLIQGGGGGGGKSTPYGLALFLYLNHPKKLTSHPVKLAHSSLSRRSRMMAFGSGMISSDFLAISRIVNCGYERCFKDIASTF